MFLLFLRPLHSLTPLLTNNSLARKEQVPPDLEEPDQLGSFCQTKTLMYSQALSIYILNKYLAIVVSLCTLIDNHLGTLLAELLGSCRQQQMR